MVVVLALVMVGSRGGDDNDSAGSVLAIGVYHWASQFCITHFSEIILAQRQVAKAAISAQSDQKPAVIEGK